MIRPGDTIVIAGDSWGCGEWDYIDDITLGVTHLGLEKYFTDYGCKVHNLSRGGASNSDSIKQLNYNFLKWAKPDIIFWLQTDPMRDLRPYEKSSFPQTISDLIKQQNVLLEKTYTTLNSLGMKIHCLGGTFKLSPSITSYPNLILLINSIIDFLGSKAPEFWISDWIHNENLISKEFLDELYTIPDPRKSLPKEWFQPAAAPHPNREAHRKIFEFILKC